MAFFGTRALGPKQAFAASGRPNRVPRHIPLIGHFKGCFGLWTSPPNRNFWVPALAAQRQANDDVTELGK